MELCNLNIGCNTILCVEGEHFLTTSHRSETSPDNPDICDIAYIEYAQRTHKSSIIMDGPMLINSKRNNDIVGFINRYITATDGIQVKRATIILAEDMTAHVEASLPANSWVGEVSSDLCDSSYECVRTARLSDIRMSIPHFGVFIKKATLNLSNHGENRVIHCSLNVEAYLVGEKSTKPLADVPELIIEKYDLTAGVDTWVPLLPSLSEYKVEGWKCVSGAVASDGHHHIAEYQAVFTLTPPD